MAGIFAGCPFVDSTLTLSHTPVMEKTISTAYPVFLARVSDRRPDRNRIGCKKNGYGSESADLFLGVGGFSCLDLCHQRVGRRGQRLTSGGAVAD